MNKYKYIKLINIDENKTDVIFIAHAGVTPKKIQKQINDTRDEVEYWELKDIIYDLLDNKLITDYILLSNIEHVTY